MRLGDLDDLKKAIEELEITEELVDYDCDDVSTTGVSQYLDRPAVLDLIDKFPTVNVTALCPVDFPTIDDPYPCCSYKRPQGEWIKVKEERMSIDMSGEIVTRYKCSKCGRIITILPSKLADYPFCHCGAEMKKGGAI